MELSVVGVIMVPTFGGSKVPNLALCLNHKLSLEENYCGRVKK